jgi:glycine/D-amino acid oxidase-like deaminating enzyme
MEPIDLPDSPASLWLAEYGDYQPEPPLAGEVRTDVAVIGGGYLGMATAIALRRRGDPPSVAVLEAREVGYGASGRNGSFAMTVVGLGFGTMAMLRGRRFLRRTHAYMEQCVDSLERFIDDAGLECGKIRPGFLRVATTPAYVGRLRKQVSLMSSLGFAGIEWIDAEAVRSMVDSRRYLGAMWEPRLLLMDPARLVREEKRHAISLGAAVYENSPVLAVARVPGTHGEYRLLTPGGVVSAGKLVYAANAYSHQFGDLAPLQTPAFTYMIATEPLTAGQLAPIGWSGQQGLEDARNLIHYYRITPDHRIVMGGGPVGLGSGAGLDHDRDERAWAHLEQHVRWLWPHLSDVAVTHRWGGPFSVTMDLTPALGYAAEDRTAVYGLGCIGHGVSMSYLNGHVLADLVAGDGTDAVTRQCPFVNRRVVRWPREPAATAAKYAIRAYLQAEDAFNERPLTRAPAAGIPEQPPAAVPHQRRRPGLSRARRHAASGGPARP